MNITIKRPRTSVAIAAFVIFTVVMHFSFPPSTTPPYLPTPGRLATIFLFDMMLICLGLAVQAWTRDRKRYTFLGRLAYVLTLFISILLSIGVTVYLMQKFFPR
jgi:hypothetical protein